MRYTYPIRMFEISRAAGAVPIPDQGRRVAKGANLDEVLKTARGILEGEGREVRSISLGQGEVVAVCYAARTQDARAMRESARRYPGR